MDSTWTIRRNENPSGLLNIPNIRSAVFLVKDRGRELGITGIREVEIKGVDAIISFR
jgi:hypothetical protein